MSYSQSPPHSFGYGSGDVSPRCEESMYLEPSWTTSKNNNVDYASEEDSNQSFSSDELEGPIPRLAELNCVEPDYHCQITGTNPILGSYVDTYGWQRKHPQFWDQMDVNLWIQSHAMNLNLTNVRSEAFAGVDGPAMCGMMIEGFQERDPTYGGELYLAFNHVLYTTQLYQEPYIDHQPTQSEYEAPENQMTSIERYVNNISFDQDDRFRSLPTFEELGRSLGSRTAPTAEPVTLKTEPFERPPSPTDSEASSTISTKPNRRGRSKGKLWEFVLNLLLDDTTNPSIIKWEDRKIGVFRIVKSDEVAKKWGIRKSNPSMTYEKMSRAMRYYYRKNILERIDGRRLVYKFGSTSRGWQI